MLNDTEFDQWCHRLQLSESAKREIQLIRSSEPSRLVGGGKQNVSGRYPSRKMAATIQFESHKVELPFIYQLEGDEEVLEYYDQPLPLKLNHQSAKGRNFSFYITPDFFVIGTESAGWVECKTEENLQKLSQRDSKRYFLDEDNKWRSPPAEAYAQQFGCYFRLWSNAEIDWTLHRNLEFLSDYYRADEYEVPATASQTVVSMVSAQPGITLLELLHHASGVGADDIYYLISEEQIYLDLTASAIVEPEKCFVFRDRVSALSYSAALDSQTVANPLNSPAIDLVPGKSVLYDGKPLTITFVGETTVLFQTIDQKSIELTLSTFESLVSRGRITALAGERGFGVSSEITDALRRASVEDLARANRCYCALQPYLDGKPIPRNVPQERSLRNWLRAYLQAQQQYGCGYLGLLGFQCQKGNRNRKLAPFVLEHLQRFISERYESKRQPRKMATYGEFVNFCCQSGVPERHIPSYKTFIREVKLNSGCEQTKKRAGSRAAYPQEPFYWELELTTRRHGDLPLHIAHVDSTQADIELRCSVTGKVLGRPWVTMLVDAFSRRILAVYASYDHPSYRSCMMVLRICVRRYGRLPQVIVTDNGKEFHSTYFESLLALFECTLKHRPAAKSRFSSTCERLFGTTNTQFFHNLAGNTQITRQVRLVTKSVNPKNLSLWTLGLLYSYLCEWAYEVYDTTEHPALEGQTPQSCFTEGIARYGSRLHKRIPYDENFRILTLPTTDRGKAKVQIGKGIKVNYKYYWSNAFRDPEIENTLVYVRYDPFNAGIAYAYVRGQWVECISEYFALFRGRSEKEILLATAQLKKQKQNHSSKYKLRAKQIGQFLESVASEEVLLEQRLRDQQVKEVFRVIEGGLANLTPYELPQVADVLDLQSSQTSTSPVNEDIETNTPISEESDRLSRPKSRKVFKIY